MKLSEHTYPEVIARCLSNALFNLLEEMEGIICQGEDEDGHFKKYIAWKEGPHIRIMETDIPEEVGAFCRLHKNKEDAITKSTLENTNYIEI